MNGLCRGSSLEELRQRQPNKRFSAPQALSIMAPIMNAVAYLHNQQPPIIHRDIKPANIIVPLSGNEAVLVSDPHQLAPPIAFFYLAVHQTRRHLPQPSSLPPTIPLEPLSKMGS